MDPSAQRYIVSLRRHAPTFLSPTHKGVAGFVGCILIEQTPVLWSRKMSTINLAADDMQIVSEGYLDGSFEAKVLMVVT
ncbi:hypothetical protein CDAR_114681 [Caerostris darwini]|uniref:Uncharacterized protein n=1 Tax=Caerostris darwini TaxID=1538125 RepID=A0AAV4ME25_9ARAC|nr:hypothetical protein CDAR_114681 [Caerostris darwini]